MDDAVDLLGAGVRNLSPEQEFHEMINRAGLIFWLRRNGWQESDTEVETFFTMPSVTHRGFYLLLTLWKTRVTLSVCILTDDSYEEVIGRELYSRLEYRNGLPTIPGLADSVHSPHRRIKA
jgi:hypothetical protein